MAGAVLIKLFARRDYVEAHRAHHWQPRRLGMGRGSGLVDMKTTALTFLIVMVVSSSVVLGADMFSGTWKVSVAKSKFDPGPGLKDRS